MNEPYDDGPGGTGQYTHKIYHVGKHLPGIVRNNNIDLDFPTICSDVS